MRWSSKKRDEGDAGLALKAEREESSRSQGSLSARDNGLPVSVQEVIGMQRLAGNQAVLQMLRSDSNPAGKSEAGGQDATGSGTNGGVGDVRLHTGPEAARAARAMGVQAFTWGSDIFFGEGKYRPQTKSGMQLLSHELAHVAQQRSSSGSAAGNATLEAEAQRAESGNGLAPGNFSSAGGVRVQGKADADHKGFWSSVGGAIASAGEAVWGGIKAVGRGIATAAEGVWSGLKWLGTQIFDKIAGVFGRVMQWITRLPVRVGRLLSGLIHGIETVRPWSLAWWESLTHINTWEHFLSWVGARLIDVLEIAGVGEILETVNEFVKFNTRALSSSEVAIAQKIFGKSINYMLVRIDQHAVLGPAFTGRAFTSFHTINAWGDLEDSVLIHELTHVWQYERAGAIYMAQALHAQIERGRGAYDYGGPDGLKDARAKGKGLLSFNREEQAQIVQDFYLIKHGQPPWVDGGTAADLPLYAHFVKTVSTMSDSELLA